MPHGLVEGVGGFLKSDFTVKTANYTLAAGDKVIAEHATPATRLTFTLPATCPAGAVILVKTGLNTGGFKIAQNTGQIVLVDGQAATTGGSGYWQSDSADAALALVCTQADTKFELVALAGRIKSDANAYRGTAEAATAGTIARRGTGGVLEVGTPTSAAHATTKNYVDVNRDPKATVSFLGTLPTITTIGGSTDFHRLVVIDANTLYYIYTDGANTVKFTSSTDGGVTWSAAVTITTTSNGWNYLIASSATNLTLIYKTSTATANRVVYKNSTNSGASWGAETAITSAAKTGTLVVVKGTTKWFLLAGATNAGTFDLYTSTNTTTWTGPTTLAGTIAGQYSPDAKAFDDNNVVIVTGGSGGAGEPIVWLKTNNAFGAFVVVQKANLSSYIGSPHTLLGPTITNMMSIGSSSSSGGTLVHERGYTRDGWATLFGNSLARIGVAGQSGGLDYEPNTTIHCTTRDYILRPTGNEVILSRSDDGVSLMDICPMPWFDWTRPYFISAGTPDDGTTLFYVGPTGSDSKTNVCIKVVIS